MPPLLAEAGTLGNLLPLAGVMAAAGACAGVLAGFLGVGGGIILVPLLYHAFTVIGVDEAVRMHMSVGTSLAVIIPTSIRSLMKHRAAGAVDMGVLRRWAVPVVLGVAAGSVVASAVDGTALTLIFVTLAFCVSVYLVFAPETWRLGAALPGPAPMSAIGGLIGFLSTLIGIGGGSFAVPVMTLYGQPIHRAVGTSSGLGFLISIPAAIGFVWAGWGEAMRPPFSLGYVNLVAWAFVVPITVLTVPYGVRLAHSLDRRLLRRAFGGFLALNAGLLLMSQLG